jgi:hypothetical protein
MALNVALLTSQIQRVFDLKLADKADIARQLASAYQVYALAAQAPTGSPVILKGNENQAMSSALQTLLRGQFPPAQASQALANAISAFWLVPPVFAGPGFATAILPQSAVGKMRSVRVKSAAAAASALASAFDLMTRTVFITSPPPLPSGPLV